MAKAIAKVEESGIVPFGNRYPIANFEPAELRELIEENLGGDLNPNLLPRIKCPSGGAPFFSVTDPEGDEQAVPYVDGVIVCWEDQRSMWIKNLDEGGGGSPPDCRGMLVAIDSSGSKEWFGQGVRWPGDNPQEDHQCSRCKFSQFGSADKGEGKKCSEKRLLGFLQPEKVLPTIILVPATSIKALKEYMVSLFSDRRRAFHSVITRIGLQKAESKGGIKYSAMTFSCVQELEAQDAAVTKAYGLSIKPLLIKVTAAAPRAGTETSSAFDAADLQGMDPGEDDGGTEAYENSAYGPGGAFDTGADDDLPADL